MNTKRTTLLAVVISAAFISIAEIPSEKPEVSAPPMGNARLLNFSNRGFVGTGEQVMIPGFVVSGDGGKTFLIRAVGPTLETLGVEGALQDPYMSIRREPVPGMFYPTVVIGNDDWDENSRGAEVAQLAQQVGAFALLPASKDAALVVGLGAGVYTVVVGSGDGGTGVALVEIYILDEYAQQTQTTSPSRR